MAKNITYIGVGAAGSTDGGSNPTATLPSGLADDDLMLCAFWSREIVDGSVAISAGWTELYNNRSANGLLALWYRFRQTGDLAPTITLTNHTGGASGDDVIVQIAAWRGVDTANPFHELGVMYDSPNGQDIGTSDNEFAIPGVTVPRAGLMVIIGGKRDDWTSVDEFTENQSASGLTYIEISEPDTTAGADAGMVWDYAINPIGNPEVDILGGFFNITGGASALGRGVSLSLNLDADAFDVADHLPAYCAQSHPETDSGVPGGPIDPLMRALFTDLAASDDVEVLSDDAADVGQNFYISGRDGSGNFVWEINSLNGTTAVICSTMGVIERLEEFRMLDDDFIGNITVRRSVAGADIGVVPEGEIGFKRVFRGAYANDNVSKDYYEKVFLRNIHPTVSVINLEIDEDADPAADLTFTLAAAINDEAYTTDRITTPGTDDTNPDTFDASAKDSPSDLEPGDAIGVWLKLTVAAGQTNTKNTYTLGVAGDTI